MKRYRDSVVFQGIAEHLPSSRCVSSPFQVENFYYFPAFGAKSFAYITTDILLLTVYQLSNTHSLEWYS